MLRRTTLTTAAALLCALHTDALHACGDTDAGPVYAPTQHPPLPLTGFLHGSVGLVEREWSVVFLVGAYRQLTPVGLSDPEREAFARRVARVWDSVPAPLIEPSLPPTVAPAERAGLDAWTAARAALGLAPLSVSNGWTTSYQWVGNCLDDGFARAAATLRERTEREGVASASLHAWVSAQDAVFSNCGETPGAGPDPLPAAAPAGERRERDYQIASAEFYAGDFADAERDYRAIAADRDAPRAQLARYMVVRTIVRAAQRGRDTPDAAGLDRALTEADAILADSALDPIEAMTLRYRGWIQHLRNPLEQGHLAATALGRDRLDDRFDELLGDFADAVNHRPDTLFRRLPNDADRLSTFVAIVRRQDAALGAPALSVAIDHLHSTHATVWLVAALLAVDDASAPAVPELLRAASAVARSDPGYVTVQFHRLRIAAARREPDVHRALVALERSLTPDDGPFARNRVRELAAATAPDLDAFLAEAHGMAGGWREGETLAVPLGQSGATTMPDSLSPLGEQALGAGVPLSVLLRAARSPSLPVGLRARVARAALVRAALLRDALSFEAARRTLPTLPVDDPLRALAESRSPEMQRYELVRAMLSGDADRLLLSPWLDARAGREWLQERCAIAAPEEFPAAGFLTAAEQRDLARERGAVLAMGDRRAFMASELAALAPALLREPTYPRALHDAVMATRNNGCPARAMVHGASRRAFDVLHRRFAQARETHDTPYWY